MKHAACLCLSALAACAGAPLGPAGGVTPAEAAPARDAEATLAPELLREDLRVLRETLEAAHAGLYRYTPKAELDAAFHAAEAELDQPMTALAFYRLLVPLIDLIHDAHTSLEFGALRTRHLRSTTPVLPLDVHYSGGRAYIEQSFAGDADVPVGSELLSINGRGMAEITERILRARSADGYNRAPKYRSAGMTFWLDYLELVEQAETFELELRAPRTGTVERRTVAGVPAPVLNAARQRFATPRRSELALQLIEQDSVALLSIPRLDDLALAARFAECFEQLASSASVKALVIDLRGNGGGYDELNTELCSYLVPHAYRLYARFEHRARDWDALRHAAYETDDFFNRAELERTTPEERAAALRARTLAEALDENCRGNPAAGIHLPKEKDVFRGDLYVLVDGGSASSGGEVPALLHFLGRATLVGEEPNAAYQGVTAGIVPTLTLPHSGFSLGVPLIAYHNAVLPGVCEGRGAPPHFVVEQTLADSLAGRDTVLDYTLALIRARAPQAVR